MPVAFRKAGSPDRECDRAEAGSRNFSEGKISVTESCGSLQGNLLLKICFKDEVSGPRNVDEYLRPHQ